jgi:glycosyltransferase involved in cell wall biosynthesis
MTARARVLLIAEAANPEWVSVPLIGWSLSRALSKIADVHVITQIRNRDAFLRAGLIEGEDFTAINSEKIEARSHQLASMLRMGEGKGWTTLQAFQSLTYSYFEHLVWQQFGDDIKNGRYDIVHRITPMSPTSPSPIARKCEAAGVTFVIGPLNGGVPWPKQFGAERRREREWLSYVRDAYKLLPGRNSTLAAAKAIIVGSRHTESEIPNRYRDKCVYISESAVDLSRFSCPVKTDISTPLRACFIGRLVPYKGADILIKAAAPLLREGRLEIDIIGDGPMMDELRTLITHEGVGEAVNLLGWVPHTELKTIAINSDIFAFPSIREFGGTSILETMAIGLVPVIVDYAGPGENVIDGIGFKLPVAARDELIESFRIKLGEIVDTPEQLLEMRKRGRTWIEDKFTWERKAEQISGVYDWARGLRQERPVPFGSNL